MYRRDVAALMTAVMLTPAAIAGSVAGNGGATEITQILNNGELMMQVQNTVKVLSETQKQYKSTMDNIRQGLDFGALNQTFADIKMVKNRANELKDLYKSTQNVYRDIGAMKGKVTELRKYIEDRQKEMAILKKNPKQFFEYHAKRLGSRKAAATVLLGQVAQSQADIESAAANARASQVELEKMAGNSNITHSKQFQFMSQQMVLMNANINKLVELNTAIMQEKVQKEIEVGITEEEASVEMQRKLNQRSYDVNKAFIDSYKKN